MKQNEQMYMWTLRKLIDMKYSLVGAIVIKNTKCYEMVSFVFCPIHGSKRMRTESRLFRIPRSFVSCPVSSGHTSASLLPSSPETGQNWSSVSPVSVENALVRILS